jgi:hypothetical protein
LQSQRCVEVTQVTQLQIIACQIEQTAPVLLDQGFQLFRVLAVGAGQQVDPRFIRRLPSFQRLIDVHEHLLLEDDDPLFVQRPQSGVGNTLATAMLHGVSLGGLDDQLIGLPGQ